MNKITLIASVVLGIINPVLAAEIYVDSASSAQSPDGSVDSPYKTIAAAVTAANSIYEQNEETSVINIKGGEYTIATADDLISVTASNLTIQAWAGTGTPKIVLDSELSVAANNPEVIIIEDTALDCTITGLEFDFCVSCKSEHSGNSLGEKGRLISVYAGNCTVEKCKFYQNKISTVRYGGQGIVVSRAPQKSTTIGYNLVVRNCLFSNVGTTLSESRPVHIAYQGKIINNTFDGCTGYFYPIKQTDLGCFISNKVINCTAPILSNGGNYNEFDNGEIAYNIFINNSDTTPFFQKNYRGMDSVKIHHNTIVGGGAFLRIFSENELDWKPSVYNNLVILPKENSLIIQEDTIKFKSERTTTFRKGASFYNNVYLASDFSGGTALELDNYKLEAATPNDQGLFIGENIELSEEPRFLETNDMNSENYYRLNSVRYQWVLGADFTHGIEPAYVGAVEPVASEYSPGDFFVIDNFAIASGELFKSSELIFEVKYSENAGQVEISIDFDGDGSYDYVGTETRIKYSYSRAGKYAPVLKAVDNATGKEKIIEMQAIEIRDKYFYVDICADSNGNGTEELPYNDIKEAILNAHNYGSVICVRGGEDREYHISTSEDLIVVDRPNIKIKSWGDYGNPQFIISHELSKAVENPCVVSIEAEATDVIISELNFVWYGNLNETYPGSSIGAGGRIISTSAERTLIKNCNFRIEGASKFSGIVNNAFAVACAIGDNNTSPGEGLRVEGCMFEGLTGDERQMNAILCGRNVEVVQNVFTNCNKAFTYCKNAHNNHIGVVSNVFFECAKVPGASPWGPWNYTQNADISYNIFVTSTGEPFITKGNTGLNGNVSIHHNTVVGASEFMEISVSTDALRPQIRDNLIILNQGGVVIDDKSTAIPEGMTSAFKSETSFSNNVYLASAFSGGTATELTGYRMNVEPVNCTVLSAAPRFMSTDLSSPDFMRLKSKKTDWPYAASSAGGYPDYVGAVEPLYCPGGLAVTVR